MKYGDDDLRFNNSNFIITNELCLSSDKFLGNSESTFETNLSYSPADERILGKYFCAYDWTLILGNYLYCIARLSV